MAESRVTHLVNSILSRFSIGRCSSLTEGREVPQMGLQSLETGIKITTMRSDLGEAQTGSSEGRNPPQRRLARRQGNLESSQRVSVRTAREEGHAVTACRSAQWQVAGTEKKLSKTALQQSSSTAIHSVGD